MPSIKVFQQENNRYYQVNVDLISSILDKVYGSPSDATMDFFLRISTTLTKSDGTSFGATVVRNLDDVPPGYSAATDFTELIDDYIEYYVNTAELGQSSSSSDSKSSSYSSISSLSSGSSSSDSNSSLSSLTSSSDSTDGI